MKFLSFFKAQVNFHILWKPLLLTPGQYNCLLALDFSLSLVSIKLVCTTVSTLETSDYIST